MDSFTLAVVIGMGVVLVIFVGMFVIDRGPGDKGPDSSGPRGG